MPYELSDTTFRHLAELIKLKTGIHIPDSKKYLVENRLFKVIEDFNLKGYDEYLYVLKYSPNGREMDRLVESITTNETYFFREPRQFEILIDEIVPKVIESKAGMKNLRVWSAACSSGEEPYTIVMMMRELRPDVTLDVWGTDISKKVVESALRGVYSSYSVRNVPVQYMNKYFTETSGGFALSPQVKSAVRFKELNLLGGRRMPEATGMDVIFCRNVLIYFDDKTKQQAVSMLYDSLKPGGYLIIGSSESLHNVTRAFRPITINRVVVYEKF